MGKKAKIIAAAAISAVLLSSCSSMTEVRVKPNRNLIGSYTNAKTAIKTETIRINILKGLRGTDNAVPVVLPPVVRPFWIVDHVNSDGVFVRGHWTFIKIRGFEWYIQAIENDQNINKILRENQ